MSASLLKLHHAGHSGRHGWTSKKRAGSPESPRSPSIRRESNTPTSAPPASISSGNPPARRSRLKGGSTLDPRVILETLLIRLALPRAD